MTPFKWDKSLKYNIKSDKIYDKQHKLRYREMKVKHYILGAALGRTGQPIRTQQKPQKIVRSNWIRFRASGAEAQFVGMGRAFTAIFTPLKMPLLTLKGSTSWGGMYKASWPPALSLFRVQFNGYRGYRWLVLWLVKWAPCHALVRGAVPFVSIFYYFFLVQVLGACGW